MKRTETLTILSFFVIASLMLVIPSADAAEPIITHTESSISVDMSDIISDIGTDFEYKVKISNACDDVDFESGMLHKTVMIDALSQSKITIPISGLEKGEDYDVSYTIKDQGEKTQFPIYCIESLGTVESVSADVDTESDIDIGVEIVRSEIVGDSWYSYSIVDESITIDYLIDNNADGVVDITIADPLQGCGAGTLKEDLIHEDWDWTGIDSRTYDVERGIMYHVHVEAFDDIAKVNYSDEFCFDIAEIVYYPVIEPPIITGYERGNAGVKINWEPTTDITVRYDIAYREFESSDDFVIYENVWYTENYLVLPFPAEKYLEFKVRIDPNGGDHIRNGDESEWTDSIVVDPYIDRPVTVIFDDDSVVELNEKNDVNAVYDKSNRELSIAWDFGTNPDRTSCNLKTEYLTYDVLGLNATSDFMGVNYVRTSYLHFLGYDWTNTADNYVAISNSIETLIDCKADDFKMTVPTTDMFSSFFTFTQFTTSGDKIKFELQVAISDKWDLTPKECGYLDPITEEFAYKRFVWDSEDEEVDVFDPVEDCWVNDNVSVDDLVKKKSSGGCSDCTPPTLGKDSDGVQRVWNGIGINGHFEDGSYFYTEYPMQYTEIGKLNNIVVKYWENHGPYNIEVIQLGIGVNKVGSSLGESQAIIEVWMDYFSNDIENPVIGTIKVVDRDGILDYVAAVPSLTNCNQSDEQTINQCLQVEFVYSYAKVPESPVLMSNAFDYKRNTINDYFNDGLTVIDPNYVEPIAPEPYKYECNDRVKPTMTRSNCVFADIVKIEQDKALAVFNSTSISNNE